MKAKHIDDECQIRTRDGYVQVAGVQTTRFGQLVFQLADNHVTAPTDPERELPAIYEVDWPLVEGERMML